MRYPAQAAAIETPARRRCKNLRPPKSARRNCAITKIPKRNSVLTIPQSSLVVQAGDQQLADQGRQPDRARRPGLSARRRHGRRVCGRRRLAEISPAHRRTTGASTALVDADARVRRDRADQRRERHRDGTPARRDQPSLAHDPAVAGARRQRTHHDALQKLRAAHATQFITDDPKADLSAFGLQPADLDLWLGPRHQFRRRRPRRQKSDERRGADVRPARRLGRRRGRRRRNRWRPGAARSRISAIRICWN